MIPNQFRRLDQHDTDSMSSCLLLHVQKARLENFFSIVEIHEAILRNQVLVKLLKGLMIL
jgi:hypothetical protein